MFNDPCSGSQDDFDQATFPITDSADSSAEIRHGFRALAQRPDQTQNIHNHHKYRQQIQHHHVQSPHHSHQMQWPNIQNYHVHNYQGHRPGADSQYHYQSTQRDMDPQEYLGALEQEEKAHETKSFFAKYSSDGVYTGPLNLPGVQISSSRTPTSLSSFHAVVGHNEAWGSASAGAADAPEPAKPATDAELDQAFQDRVNVLVQHSSDTKYQGMIRNADHAARYRRAFWKAKVRGKKGYDQKCADYPLDEAGQLAARQRLFEAIVNLGGEQDPVSDNGQFLTCLAVNKVRSASSLELELVVDSLMVRLSSLVTV